MLGPSWWLLYTFVGVWAQHFFPGMDFLAPGLLVSLQEERRGTIIWLTVCWILLQEGMGSLFFGSTLLWYGCLILAFHLGRGLFSSTSVTLMCLLGAFLGALHFLFTLMIMRLEVMAFPFERVLFEAVLQAALTPILWWVAHQLYPRRLRSDERSV